MPTATGTPVFETVGGDASLATATYTASGATTSTTETLSEVAKNASDALSSAQSNDGHTPLSTLTVSGAASIPIPASGNAYYVVSATAASQLQFSGSAASGQQQTITLEVVSGGYVVTLPTDNVVPSDSTISLPVSATLESGFNTRLAYSVRDGSSNIVGGV